MDFDFLKIIISIVVALLGWLVVHRFTSERDRKNAQRELKTKYLIEAYRNIEKACGHNDSLPPELNRCIESAIADVQLFGSLTQINLARAFTENMIKKSFSDPRELLADLRYQLRKELKLDKTSTDPNDIFHWRLIDKK